MDNQLIWLIYIYFVTGLMLLLTVIIRHHLNSDLKFMKKQFFNNVCNYWCLSHLIMYILLGFFAPKYWYVSFIMSIIWEYIELYLEKHKIYIYSNIQNDIITNTFGLIFGLGLGTLVNFF